MAPVVQSHLVKRLDEVSINELLQHSLKSKSLSYTDHLSLINNEDLLYALNFHFPFFFFKWLQTLLASKNGMYF